MACKGFIILVQLTYIITINLGHIITLSLIMDPSYLAKLINLLSPGTALTSGNHIFLAFIEQLRKITTTGQFSLSNYKA